MQVIDIDALDAKILKAAPELVFQELRGHAVAARGDVFGAKDPPLNVLVEKILVGVSGHGAIGSKVAALGA